MKLYLATGNPHKVAELTRLFAEAGLKIAVRDANEAGGMPRVEEDAPDFVGNARLKATALRKRVPDDAWVLADDSGLEVAALGGEPGIRSARYAGVGATDADNRTKLLHRLREVTGEGRRARFVCVLVLLGPHGEEKVFEGVCPGRIAMEETGRAGFGYDPVFVPDGLRRTFAEVESAVKDELSHRGRALRVFADWARGRITGVSS